MPQHPNSLYFTVNHYVLYSWHFLNVGLGLESKYSIVALLIPQYKYRYIAALYF